MLPSTQTKKNFFLQLCHILITQQTFQINITSLIKTYFESRNVMGNLMQFLFYHYVSYVDFHAQTTICLTTH